jgi:hypothetical protein
MTKIRYPAVIALAFTLLAPAAMAQIRPNPNLSGMECREMANAYQKLADQYGGMAAMARRQVHVVGDLIEDINASAELRAALEKLRDAHRTVGPNFEDLRAAFQAATDAFRKCARVTH